MTTAKKYWMHPWRDPDLLRPMATGAVLLSVIVVAADVVVVDE